MLSPSLPLDALPAFGQQTQQLRQRPMLIFSSALHQSGMQHACTKFRMRLSKLECRKSACVCIRSVMRLCLQAARPRARAIGTVLARFDARSLQLKVLMH